jgi:hypothetical protein
MQGTGGSTVFHERRWDIMPHDLLGPVAWPPGDIMSRMFSSRHPFPLFWSMAESSRRIPSNNLRSCSRVPCILRSLASPLHFQGPSQHRLGPFPPNRWDSSSAVSKKEDIEDLEYD